MLDNPGAIYQVAPDEAPYVDELDCGTLAASRQVYGRGALIFGWSVCEATGAAVAKVRIRDGQNVGGAVLAPISLAAGGSLAVMGGDLGVRATAGIFVEVVSGSVELVLYLGPFG